MSGWYSMERGWQDHGVFAKAEFSERDAWVWLIEKAVHCDVTVAISGVPVKLVRGQLSYSTRYLADAWKWHKNKVTRFLEKLKKWDMVRVETGTGQNVITICNYSRYQNAEKETGTGQGQQQGQDRDSSGTNKNNDNNENKREDSPSSPPRGEDPFPVPDWLDAQAWSEYRKHRGKTFKRNAQRLAIGKLERWRAQGHDPTEIINNSIMNGWKGLFEPKEKNFNGPHQQKLTQHERLERASDAAVENLLADWDARHGGEEILALEGLGQPEFRDIPRLRQTTGSGGQHHPGLRADPRTVPAAGNQGSLPDLDAATLDHADAGGHSGADQ